MAVQRFRSIEEMNAAPVRRRADDGFERWIRHCARYARLAPPRRLRGVFKYRSLEEAQRARLFARAGAAPGEPHRAMDTGDRPPRSSAPDE